MDLKKIPTQHLLASLSVGTPVLPPLTTALENWMHDRDIHPGGTKVLAKVLYDEFAAWWTQVYGNIGEAPTSTAWGREIRKYLKRGRGAAGRFYYVSRVSNEEMVEKMGG